MDTGRQPQAGLLHSDDTFTPNLAVLFRYRFSNLETVALGGFDLDVMVEGAPFRG